MSVYHTAHVRKKKKDKKKTGGRTVLEQAAMSDKDRDWDRAQASDSSISHQGSQNRHNRDRDVASIGYLEELSHSTDSTGLQVR